MKPLRLSYLFRSAFLVCLLMGSSIQINAQDLPLTTTSEEAKATFIEGRELFDNIRFDEARDVFDQALQEDPNFAIANVYRALTATTDTDFVHYLSQAVSVKSEVSDGERLLIESIHANAKSQPMEAISNLKEAIELYPQDKRLHHMLGIAYQGVNMNDKAEEKYRSSIDIDPEFAPPYNNLGYLYKGSENFVKSEEAFKNYVRILPEEANPHDSIADLYTKMGKHDLAIEHYQKALDLNPTFFFSQQKIGDNLIFKGLYDDGRTAYKKAIEMAPDATNKIFLHQALASSYLYEDNYGQASEEATAAIQWAEDESLPEVTATLHQLKTMMDIEQDQFEEADKNLMACNEIIESGKLTEDRKQKLELISLRNYAIKAAKQSDFEKASQKAEKMHEHAQQSENPNQMEIYQLVKGIIHYEQGDFAKAIDVLKQSDPNNAYGQFYLALSYQNAGMRDEARDLLTKVAQWNEHSLEYALVRNKARSAARMDMAVEEQN